MSLRRYFHPTIWSRGQDYYRSDLVTDFKAEGTHFSAKVQGTRLYDVMLNVSGDNLYKARCSCPYAADGSFCKHEAALAARVQFYLGHERRISAVTVRPFVSDPKVFRISTMSLIRKNTAPTANMMLNGDGAAMTLLIATQLSSMIAPM